MSATTPAEVPGWICDAVIGLVTTAYERGRAAAAAEVVDQPTGTEPDYLTRREAAALMRVSLTTVNGLIQRGDVQSTKVGARRFVAREAALAYLSSPGTTPAGGQPTTDERAAGRHSSPRSAAA